MVDKTTFITLLLLSRDFYCHQYFRKTTLYDNNGDGLFTGLAIKTTQAHSIVSCSVKCLETTNCKLEAYNTNSTECIIGVNDENATVAVQVDMVSGLWVVFTTTPADEEYKVNENIEQPDWVCSNTSCYLLVVKEMDWTKSSGQCLSEDPFSHLVTLTTETERDFIVDFLSTSNPSTHTSLVWTGGKHFNSTDGNYTWVTGEHWDWVDWTPNQSHNLNDTVSEELCIAMSPVDGVSAGLLAHVSCDTKLPHICEKEIDYI